MAVGCGLRQQELQDTGLCLSASCLSCPLRFAACSATHEYEAWKIPDGEQKTEFANYLQKSFVAAITDTPRCVIGAAPYHQVRLFWVARNAVSPDIAWEKVGNLNELRSFMG